MSKPKEILELERIYNITLQESAIVEPHIDNCYQLNNKNEVLALNLSGNQITEIKGLEKLTQLQKLCLTRNYIEKIEGLEKLIQLQELWLSTNRITEINGLNTLIHLKSLFLYDNQISEINNLQELIQLQSLHLSGNNITEIKGLEKLGQLRMLRLYDNSLTEIKGLDKLDQLYSLELYNNRITEIKGIDQLVQLQWLYLQGNQIVEINNLEQFHKLIMLDLSENQIKEIKGLESLTKLRWLRLANNQIELIEPLENIIESFNELKELKIYGNQFSNPQLEKEVNNLDTVRKYFSDKRLEEEKKKIIVPLPAKVMLLGNHTVGKSTFWQYFEADTIENFIKEKDVESTHILNIYKYHPDEKSLPEAMIYDFGGQDYYHGLYQAFFSEDSINVLLWNTLTNKNYSEKAKDKTENYTRHFTWDYWLYQLDYALKKRKQENESSGTSSEPILLVQTYADEDKRQNYTDDISSFDIVDTFFVSLEKSKKLLNNPVFQSSLNYLKKSLVYEIEKKRQKTKEEFSYYEAFLKYILSSEEKDCIPIQKLLNEKHYTRKQQESESNENFLGILRAELSELYRKGLVLYYNKENLNDVVWLNPTETVKHIHKNVLPPEKMKDYAGKVPEKDFIIDENIKNLLIAEKVIFFDTHDKKYIIPGYLPLSEADDYFDMIKFGFTKPDFVLKFKHFIPFGLINQLICLYGDLPDKKIFWRDQLIFTFADSYKVWIRLRFSELKIEVYISPVQDKKQELPIEIVKKAIFLNIIDLYWGEEVRYEDKKGGFSSDFSNDFASSFSFSEQVKKYITNKENEAKDKKRPIKDLYISIDGKHFIHLQELEDIEDYQVNIAVYTFKENTQELDTISHNTKPVYLFKNFSNNKILQNMKKIFISYSKEDKAEMHEFLKHTVTLQEQGIIAKPWTDEWIAFGKEWDDEIKRHIEECDIMVCLVSIDFLNTDYIRKTELKEAMNQNKMLVPIIIKPCDWENCDFAKYQVALKGKCISLNENQKYTIKENSDVERAKFWVEIIKEMRKKVF